MFGVKFIKSERGAVSKLSVPMSKKNLRYIKIRILSEIYLQKRIYDHAR